MLLNDLFLVDKWQGGYNKLTACLRVQVPHPIFSGHFPGRPVVPGACLVQLVEEMSRTAAGREIRLIRAGPIKFIAMIDPLRDGVIEMTLTAKELQAGEWQVTADGTNAGAICFRFKGVFRAGSDYAE